MKDPYVNRAVSRKINFENRIHRTFVRTPRFPLYFKSGFLSIIWTFVDVSPTIALIGPMAYTVAKAVNTTKLS